MTAKTSNPTAALPSQRFSPEALRFLDRRLIAETLAHAPATASS
jgi:hypothetical protein